jgi:hypothetical protein
MQLDIDPPYFHAEKEVHDMTIFYYLLFFFFFEDA